MNGGYMDCATCTVGQEKKKKHKYLHTNYRTEMRLLPIIMEYRLLQFDALKFFLRVHLHGLSLLNFNFSNVNYQILTKSQSSPLKLPGYKFSQHY